MESFLKMSQVVSFEILRLITLASNFAHGYWTSLWAWYMDIEDTDENGPAIRYLLSDNGMDLTPEMKTVPEKTVYVEEWYHPLGEKRCVVHYAGDPIPTSWKETPWTHVAKCPWVWVGDRDTEIDLTRTFNRYLVVGNSIRIELVQKLIHMNDKTNFIYIESGTFNELKFPGDGILIKAADNE